MALCDMGGGQLDTVYKHRTEIDHHLLTICIEKKSTLSEKTQYSTHLPKSDSLH